MKTPPLPVFVERMSPRDRRAALVIAVVALVALAWFAARPVFGVWGGVRGEIGDRRDEAALLAQKYQAWEMQKSRLEAEYGRGAAAPPLSADDARLNFLRSLRDTLLAGGMQVQSIRPQATRPVKELAGMSVSTFQVTGTCQVAQLTQTLAKLTEMPNLVLMDRLTIDVNEQQPGTLNVTMLVGTLSRTGAKR